MTNQLLDPLLSAKTDKTGFTTVNSPRLSEYHHLTSLINLRSTGSENSIEEMNELILNLEEMDNQKYKRSTAIYKSSSLPTCTKFLIPFLILTNFSLFLAANLNTGASVLLNVDIFGFEFNPDSLFNFSLVNTIEEMYEAKAYGLSALVFIWSGIWPYMKLILLLFCWFTKPEYLSIKTRGIVLEVMDFLGKWCMIDAYLMVIMSVAFRFDIVYPKKGEFKLNVVVSNEIGLYFFVMATILTLILSHVVLVYHKNSQNLQYTEKTIINRLNMEPKSFLCPCPEGSWFNVGSLEANETADKRMSLLRYTGGIRPYFRQVSFRHKLRILLFNVCMFIALVTALVLLLIGSRKETFSLEYGGLLGDAIGVFKPEVKKQWYSMLSIGYALTEDVNDDLTLGDSHVYKLSSSDLLGLYWIQFIYLCFSYYFPIVLIIFLLSLWFIPMALRDQKILFYSIQIVSSWSAIEVYLVSLIATKYEISQFAKFLVKQPCTELEYLLKTECFNVNTQFYSGIYYLIVSTSLLLLSTHIILFNATKAIEFRESIAILELKEKYS